MTCAGRKPLPGDSRETAAVREVTERLKSAYAGRRTAQEIEAAVGKAYHHLRDRPVRDFRPRPGGTPSPPHPGRPPRSGRNGLISRSPLGRHLAEANRSTRILVVTAGSRGDVAPCTGLGRRLPDADHQVAAATHPSFAALAGGCGLDSRPVPEDPQGLLRDRARATSPEAPRALTRAHADKLADGAGGRGGRNRPAAHRLRPGTTQPDGR
ncbi:three-helix bundle dimerization domain-containing protein [Streptomyces sp. NWU339]|uniref:three-helix bundle dimerization domain-containing protein n=1 Tax=Streptomyces sp. NWU339 TaxID=2185284 RepID=UPI0035C860E0